MSRIIARTGVNRRMALKAMAAMGMAVPGLGYGAETSLQAKGGAGPKGTLTDPHLTQPQVLWGRTLNEDALRTLATLADLILPADARSPAASALGAHDFIDEWVSAPYETQQEDRRLLLDGLDWLAAVSIERYESAFVDLDLVQQTAICDDICAPGGAMEENAIGVRFFSLVRDLTAAAVWTTEEGMADLQYVGNVALPKWELPPAAVLEHLGLKDAT